MNAARAGGTHAQPVLDAVLVDNHGPLDGGGLAGQPEADLLEVATARVLVRGLNNDPPVLVVLDSVVLKSNSYSHLYI